MWAQSLSTTTNFGTKLTLSFIDEQTVKDGCAGIVRSTLAESIRNSRNKANAAFMFLVDDMLFYRSLSLSTALANLFDNLNSDCPFALQLRLHSDVCRSITQNNRECFPPKMMKNNNNIEGNYYYYIVFI